jgi:TonB family protein
VTALASNYRTFELPWTPSEEEERRFKRLLLIAFIIFALGGLVIPLLPVEERALAPPVPEEAVKLVLQPPPVPPKPVAKPKEEPKPVVEEKPKPVPVDKAEEARKKAQKQVNAWKDQLADLRNTLQPNQPQQLTNKIEGPSASERSLITSQVVSGSGGINTASLSRGFGGSVGTLNGHQTTQGISSFADSINKGHAEATRTGASGKGARSREEIEIVFDRNKAAIYALYNRALRDNPTLQGKVVVELTIAASGEVTACRIVTSELNDQELEKKLVARIRMFHFDPKDVESITTTKPIDFFPA